MQTFMSGAEAMTPAARAVEAAALAIHGTPERKAGWSLAWHAEALATQDAYRRDAVLALRAGLAELASDPATTGMCAAEMAAEMEVGRADQG